METTMTPFIWTVPSREVTVKGVSLKTKGQRRRKQRQSPQRTEQR